MKHGNGIKGRDDILSGIKILMTDSFVKINLIDPLRLRKTDSEPNENGSLNTCFDGIPGPLS
jgi:hypothetical protein